MTPDKNFRLSSANKALIALMPASDAHARGQFKRMLIDAQLSEESARRQALKSKDGKRGAAEAE